MLEKKISEAMIEDLFQIITSIQTIDECKDLLKDLCTDKEIENMAQRIAAARLIKEGKTYNQIIDETDVSSATLSRVSRAYQYGKGYKKFLDKKF